MLVVRHGVPVLEEVASGRGPPPGNESRARWFTRSVNWDPALRNANRSLDRYIAALRMTDRPARIQEMAAIKRDLANLKERVSELGFIEKTFMGPASRGEMIGNIMITLMLTAYHKVQDAAERSEQEQRNLQVTFLLAAYRQDYKRYPKQLAELGPKYRVHTPDDLFSGKPLIYQPEGDGYLLYSVGLNGIDEQGHGVEDHPIGDDLSIRMPVPEPRRKK
jgi:hypothetical protein